MRSLISTLVVAASFTFAACSTAPGAAPSGTASTVPSQSTSTSIPAGVAWERTITAADFTRFNVQVSPDDLEFAPDGTLTVTFKFGDSSWTQFGNYNGGVPQPGDEGTYAYDDEANLLLTSSSGGTLTLEWQVSGDRLTLRMPEEDSAPSGEMAIVRMMTEGDYQRVQS